MTLTVDLPPELERRLRQEAQRQGVPTTEYAVQLLAKHVPPSDRREAAIALLQSWIDEDDTEEQRATSEFLIKALDEDRPSDRKLFPPELKGISW
jgi:hypothetical protein